MSKSGRGKFKLNRTMFLAVLLLTVALLSGCKLLGGSGIGGGVGPGGTVEGEIVDVETNAKLDNVAVSVSVAGKSDTFSDGTYKLTSVPTGIRTLTATAAGYEEFEAQVRVTSGVLRFDIKMTKEEVVEPDPDPTLLGGTVHAPAHQVASLPASGMWDHMLAWVSTPVAHAQAVGGVAAWAGATVKAHDWKTGKQVGSTATTDSDGKYEIEIDPEDFVEGADLMIIVEKGDMRMASILPNVTGDTDDADVDPETTLVAEVLGRLYKSGQDLDAGKLADAAAAIAGLQLDPAELDFRIDRGWIGKELGALNMNLELIEIQRELDLTVSGVARGLELVSELRNIGPSLVAFGGPVVDLAIEELESTVGPVLVTANERLATIVELVERADLHPLEVKAYVVKDADEDAAYEVTINITKITAEDDKDRVEANFEFKEIDGVAFASGEMEFLIEEDKPVESMDLTIVFQEGDDSALTISGIADFEWHDILVGDAVRDIAKLTITPDINGNIESPMMTGSAKMTAEFDDREWVDGDGRAVVMTKALKIENGDIWIEDVGTIKGSMEFELTPADPAAPQPYELEADIEIETADKQVKVSGEIWATGTFVKEEGSDYGAADVMLTNGIIELPGRESVNIGFTANRTGAETLELTDLSIGRGERQPLTGGATLDITPGDKLGTWDAVSFTLNLADSEGYSISVTLTVDGNEITAASGSVTDPSGQEELAEIRIEDGVPVVVYEDGEETRYESLI